MASCIRVLHLRIAHGYAEHVRCDRGARVESRCHLCSVCDDDAFPRHCRFRRWEKEQASNPELVDGTPITRYWLIPTAIRPKMFTPHPLMSSDEIRERTQKVWDRFYEMGTVWKRSACTPTLRARLAFVLLSKLYRQMYAGTGISTDSARRKKAKTSARWIAAQTRKIFQAKPMPELSYPVWKPRQKRTPVLTSITIQK